MICCVSKKNTQSIDRKQRQTTNKSQKKCDKCQALHCNAMPKRRKAQ